MEEEKREEEDEDEDEEEEGMMKLFVLEFYLHEHTCLYVRTCVYA